MSPAKADQENQFYGMLWVMPSSEYEQWFSKLDYASKGNLNFLFYFSFLVVFIVCFVMLAPKLSAASTYSFLQNAKAGYGITSLQGSIHLGNILPGKGKTHLFQTAGKLHTRNKLEKHGSIMTQDFCLPNYRYVLK